MTSPAVQTASINRGGADVISAPNDFAGHFQSLAVLSGHEDDQCDIIPRFSIQSVKDDKGDVWGYHVSGQPSDAVCEPRASCWQDRDC